MVWFGLATLVVTGLCLWAYRLTSNAAVAKVAVILCAAWSLTICLPSNYYPAVDLACLIGLVLTRSRHPAVMVIGFCFLAQLSAHALYLWVPPKLDHNAYASILDWGYLIQLLAAGAFGGGYVLDDVRRRLFDRRGAPMGLRAR